MSDQIFLKSLADDILNEAQSSESNRVYSASGFSKNNISIIHQQKRCENLAWALKYQKKIKRGDTIGIIGGSFSGIALSSFLAISSDVIIYIFEKEDTLLKKFINSGNRYLSPNLNSRELGVSFNPKFDSNTSRRILFDWDAGLAHNVANQWLREFSEYERRLPIFCFLNKSIEQQHIKLEQDKIIIDDSDNVNMKPIILDFLIDATGFGDESNQHKIKDYSYWESGHKLIYDHLSKNDKVLISGVGDSGIVEVLQYALKDFEHHHILGLWQNRSFEAHIDTQRSRAIFDKIFEFNDISLDEKIIFPEMTWWLHFPQTKKIFSVLGEIDNDYEKIFSIIDSKLQPYLQSWASNNYITMIDCDARHEFLRQGNLSIELQKEIRQEIKQEMSNLSSIKLKEIMDQIDVYDVLDIQTLFNEQRNIEITYNGLFATPYTANLSPYNLWLTKIAMSFSTVKYKQSKINKISQNEDGVYQVEYSSGIIDTYNRVVTRYGISKDHNGVFNPNHFDPQKGDFMLNERFFEGSAGETYKDLIHRRRNKLFQKSRASKNIIHKEMYKLNITAPIMHEEDKNKIKSNFPVIPDNDLKALECFVKIDCQQNLSDLLNRGCSVSYTSCDIKKKISFTY
jgi:hypothetical protein